MGILDHLQFSSVQSLSRVWFFETSWAAARQASLSITNTWRSPKPMSIELVMLPSHLILCHPLLLLPSIFPSIRVFSNESAVRIKWPKYWSFSFNISPSKEHPGLISFRMDWVDLLAVHLTCLLRNLYAGKEAAVRTGHGTTYWFQIGKDPDAGKEWRQEGRETAEDEIGWMASLTRWTWIWACSTGWWWTEKPGVLQSMGHKESNPTERLKWIHKEGIRNYNVYALKCRSILFKISTVKCPMFLLYYWVFL